MGEEKEENQITNICNWFVQLLGWIGIVLLVVGIVTKRSGFYGGFAACYIIYIIVMLFSSTFSYLRHKKTGNRMYSKMGELFKTAPVISFHCSCYHYETRHRRVRDSQGRYRTETRRERVTTYSTTERLTYYSTRDVSGLFKLDIERGLVEKKSYIKLNLKKCIDFADAISYSDYLNYKKDFWQRNRWRDVHMDFSENRDIPGFNQYELVTLKSDEPPLVGSGYFVLFTLLTFAQFYKLYIDSFCIHQSYKIRKLVSTRYNLLDNQHQEQYQSLSPALNLVSENYTYQSQEIGCEFESVVVNPPTQEELQQAEAFESYVPNYQVTEFDSQLNSGVVKDLPSFESVNYNAPPPGFEGYAGDKEIPSDMIKPGNNQTPNYQPPGVNDSQSQGYSSGGQPFITNPQNSEGNYQG